MQNQSENDNSINLDIDNLKVNKEIIDFSDVSNSTTLEGENSIMIKSTTINSQENREGLPNLQNNEQLTENEILGDVSVQHSEQQDASKEFGEYLVSRPFTSRDNFGSFNSVKTPTSSQDLTNSEKKLIYHLYTV